ncbi:hypothetical protein CLV78_1011020 [Aliiruegeria haliotis]|uniref:AcrB/AcrD/AcrF family protein n=1 Tax=Aliiruegeria haliotis TaxID=1280846 RepID=A0A2T0S0H5_9RHOB|nr:hypothetical protein CLV78_1011020 [Aliiruegeria haliotis]
MAEVFVTSSRPLCRRRSLPLVVSCPSILPADDFWPLFATAIAGGVLLSTVVSVCLAPALLALIARHKTPENAAGVRPVSVALRVAASPAAAPRPVMLALGIDPFESMGAEEIPLCLDHVGCRPCGADAVEIS